MKKGTKFSKETKEKMRQAKLRNPVRYWKGKHISKEHNAAWQAGKQLKAPKPRLGIPFTEEQKNKISATLAEGFASGKIKHWATGKHKYGYADFRLEVIKRDNSTCRLCKKYSAIVEVDHRISRKERPDLIMDLNNVRTVCVDCHKRITRGWLPEKDFRKAFLDAVIELAETDKRIVFVTADVGFSFLERWQEKYPDRFFNFGVTEQTASLICAGLALKGLRPIFYSMINFVLYRNYEMVRNGMGYHCAPVVLAGVQGSTKYKMLGFSHTSQKNEDINTLDYVPNIRIYIPMDDIELKDMVKKMFSEPYPCYIRL